MGDLPSTSVDEPRLEVVPFHGIVSRGLRSELAGRSDGPRVWQTSAPSLDRISRSDPELGWLAQAADRCGVLHHRQSTWAVQAYLRATFGDAAARDAEVAQIKEGHTSSVWVVDLETDAEARRAPVEADERRGGRVSSPFVVNVARDRAAGRELARTSHALQTLANLRPDLAIAAVEEVVTLTVPAVDVETGRHDADAPPVRVVLTRNSFVEEALEIHHWADVVGRSSGGTDPTYLLIEQFLADAENPAMITGVRGRAATIDEARVIDRTVAEVQAASGAYRIGIDEGDLVWSRGRAVVVALS